MLRALFLVVLVSLTVRISWGLLAHVTPLADFAGYHARAQRWLKTGDIGWENSMAYRTPGYPMFLGSLYACFGQTRTLPTLAHAALGAMSTGCVFLLAWSVASVRTAVIAGLLHAFSLTSVI